MTRIIQKSLALLILGFASGLPLGLIGTTLQAWYTQSGISLLSIGFLSLIGQPYAYKFLWSPWMDRYSPLFLKSMGQRRGWICFTQIILIFLLFSLSFFSPSTHPKSLAALALTIAFFSASQDISISAYLVNICDQTHEKGLGAASYVTGYRISMIFSIATALILAQHLGFSRTYQIMSGIMFLALILSLLAPEPIKNTHPHSLSEAIKKPFIEFYSRYPLKIFFGFLCLLILYKLGNAFLLSFNTTFLLRGLKFSLTEIAISNQIIGVIAAILGGLTAGLWMKKLSLFKALLIFGLIQALANLGYVLLAFYGHCFYLMTLVLLIEYFCSALGSTAFIALTMSLCHQKYSATQYSLLNALESTGSIYIGPLAGFLLAYITWVNFYWISFLLALPGLVLLILMRHHISEQSIYTREI